MSRKVWRLIPVLALCLLALLALSRPRSADASAIPTYRTNYTPENIVLSQARNGQFLTGPSAGDAYKIALDYISANKAELGLGTADLNYVVTDRYTSGNNGVTHLYLQQQVNGLLVNGAYINVNVTADGRILNLGSSFVGGVAQQANGTNPALTASEAVSAAADALGLALAEPVTVVRQVGGASQSTELSTGGISLNNIPAHLVYQPVSPTEVRLAWDLAIYPLDAQNWWNLRVDANTGQVLSQVDWVVQEHFGEAEGVGTDVAPGDGTAETSAAASSQAPLSPDSYRQQPRHCQRFPRWLA